MSSHSLFSPSASYRWLNCSGSVELEKDYKSEDSIYSIEGSAAHELAALSLQNLMSFERIKNTLGYQLKEAVPDSKYPDVEITPKMVESVGLYWKRIRGFVAWDHRLSIEQKFEYNADIFGYVDVTFLSDDTLYVIDFKYGTGITVDVLENSQLAIYGLAALRYVENRGILVKKLHIEVIQPNDRDGNMIKTAVYERDDFVEYWKPKIDDQYELIKMGITTLKTGPWCQYCRKALDCSKNTTLMAPVDSISRDPAKLAEILNQETAIREALKQAKSYAIGLLKRGVEVPGYKLVNTKSNRSWKDPKKVIKECVSIGYDQNEYMSEPALLSPNKLKGLLEPKFINKHVVRKPSGQKLVTESDNRPAAKPENPFK